MSDALSIYLRNHEAVAQARRDLFRRTAANHRDKPYADDLRQLVSEEELDLRSLRELMSGMSVRPDRVQASVLRLAERLGRLKPNGRVVRRAPLSDLVEIEGLVHAVHLKRTCWRALATLQPDGQVAAIAVEALTQRAEGQIERLTALHRSVAGAVLTSS